MGATSREAENDARWAGEYLAILSAKLEQIRGDLPAIVRAGEAIADVIAGGGLIYVFGCGHSAALTMDLFYRAGGLMLVHPIFDDRILLNHQPVTETSEWEKKEGWAPEVFAESGASMGDAIIIFSTNGRNGAPIDMALAGKAAGLVVIAVTSVGYASAFPSNHSSGKRLHEIADFVLDNHVDAGDASLDIPGLGERIGPTSTVLGSAVVQSAVVAAIARLAKQGYAPPIWMSGNLPGGPARNEKVLFRYRDRIRFL